MINFAGRVSYKDLGLPQDWSTVRLWLTSPAVLSPRSAPPKAWKKKMPHIPTLKDYSKIPESSFWDSFPTRPLPSVLTTKINFNLLQSLFMEVRHKLPTETIPWGESAISSLMEGAKAFQVDNLPSLECPNGSSLLVHGERVTDTIAQGIYKGFIAGPFSHAPLANFRSNSMNGIVQKDKLRLVMDLSRPAGSSYNENIQPYSSRKVTMSSPRQFSFSLLESGPGAIFSKHDWCDAYKNIPVKLEDLRLQGFSWLDKHFVELSLVFGSKNSVAAFDNLGELILNIACCQSGFPRHLTHRTLDDVPVVSPRRSGLTEKFSRRYKHLCSSLNIELAPDCPDNDKAFTCQTEGVVLGFRFNSNNQTWSFPKKKADMLLIQINSFLSKKVTNLLKVQELAGSLEHFGSMAPFSKAFRQPLYNLLSLFKRNTKNFIAIPTVVRSDLSIWSNMIKSSISGLPIHPRPTQPSMNSLTCTSDAAGIDLSLGPNSSGDLQFGAASILHSRDQRKFMKISRISWPPHFVFYAVDGKGTRLAAKSSTLEAIGILLPFLAFPEILKGSSVILFVDNTSVIHGWRRKHLKNDLEASVIIRTVHILASYLHCRVHVEHAPRMSTPAAILADHLSRSSSTSSEEEEITRTLECPPISPTIRGWLDNPNLDWNLPLACLQELEKKLENNPQLMK